MEATQLAGVAGPDEAGAKGGMELTLAIGRLRTSLDGHSFEELGLEGWEEVAAAVATIRLALKEGQRRAALEKIVLLCRDAEVDPKEVSTYFGAPRRRLRKRVGKGLYRDPASGRLWGGHGARPRWMREFEAGGGDREKLLVSRDEESAEGT